MTTIELTPPKLAFVLATRVALAFGAGLLVSTRLDDDQRRTLGRALVALGALTTIPAALLVLRSRQETEQ